MKMLQLQMPLLRAHAFASSAPPLARRHATRALDAAPVFQFKCTQCGKCCTGKGGTVRVNARERDELARTLQLSHRELDARYLIPAIQKIDSTAAICSYDSGEQEEDEGVESSPREWRIRATADDSQCIFLDGKRCSVYEARPTQCRTFPWWPQHLISEYDWQLAARECEGITHSGLNAKSSSATADSVGLSDVAQEAIIYDIHRSGENYSYDELQEMLGDLQEVDPNFIHEYIAELRAKFYRDVVYRDDRITVLDTFLENTPPSRSFVFNDRLHLVQSEMLLDIDNQCVDPRSLVLDVHQALCAPVLSHPPASPLVRALTQGTSIITSSPHRILVLGAGGGALVRFLLHKCPELTALDAVDPSAEVNAIARRFFGLNRVEADDKRFTLHEELGEVFVAKTISSLGEQERSTGRYDFVVVDVEAGASGANNIQAPPLSMLETEFIQSIKSLLSRGGIVAINLITTNEGASRHAASSWVREFGIENGAYIGLPKNTVLYFCRTENDEARSMDDSAEMAVETLHDRMQATQQNDPHSFGLVDIRGLQPISYLFHEPNPPC